MPIEISDDYIAGLFDGEGWFKINKNAVATLRYPTFQVTSHLAMRDKALIYTLREMFSGSITIFPPRKSTHATSYQWNTSGEATLDFAVRIGPRLIVKKKHAELAKEFQLFKRQLGPRKTNLTRVLRLMSMFEEMKELNKKGVDHV